MPTIKEHLMNLHKFEIEGGEVRIGNSKDQNPIITSCVGIACSDCPLETGILDSKDYCERHDSAQYADLYIQIKEIGNPSDILIDKFQAENPELFI